MSSFSERMGYANPPKFMQKDSMTEELSNQLCNLCEVIISDYNAFGRSLVALEKQINVTLKKLYGDFVFTQTDYLERTSFYRSGFIYNWQKLEWHQKYTFVETIFLSLKDRNLNGTKEFLKYLNETILKRENSAYRMNEECQLVAIVNDSELAEVEQTQGCHIEPVRTHFNNAVRLFSDREKPDYANAIKEAISAVESLAINLTGNEKRTLGQLIKDIDCHPSLQKAITLLYGYTSDEGGIRHSHGKEIVETDFDTAKYIIVICSALINYLLAKHI